MRIMKIKYLILSIFLILTGCGVPRNCIQCDQSSVLDTGAIITLTNQEPILYSSEIKLLKYHFSGLMAFRQMPDSSGVRIVFLSQVGLRVMEFNYKNGNINNTYCPDIIKKQSYIKFIGSIMKALLDQPDCRKTCIKNSENKSDYFCRLKNGYHELEYFNNADVHLILKKGRKLRGEAQYSRSSCLPDEIKLKMRYHSVIQMKKVDNAFK